MSSNEQMATLHHHLKFVMNFVSRKYIEIELTNILIFLQFCSAFIFHFYLHLRVWSQSSSVYPAVLLSLAQIYSKQFVLFERSEESRAPTMQLSSLSVNIAIRFIEFHLCVVACFIYRYIRSHSHSLSLTNPSFTFWHNNTCTVVVAFCVTSHFK